MSQERLRKELPPAGAAAANHAQSSQKKREWKLEYGRRRKGGKEEATKRTRERDNDKIPFSFAETGCCARFNSSIRLVKTKEEGRRIRNKETRRCGKGDKKPRRRVTKKNEDVTTQKREEKREKEGGKIHDRNEDGRS